MRRSITLWVVAFVVTLVAARWQERTGPTYPVRGEVTLGGRPFAFELLRSWSTGDQPVELKAPDGVVGRVRWRRYPTNDDWTVVPLQRKSDVLHASLPHQPPAGKLEYQVELASGPERVIVPEKAAVTRFKGEVSWKVLAPHIVCIFLALLFSTRGGLEGLFGGPRGRRYTWLTVLFLVAGGFILGPMVQKAAFGEYWTGIPWGWDLTDNKTLFMGIAWFFAAWRISTRKSARVSLVMAALVTLAVFVIPHSVWGSQIKWE